MGRQLPRHGRHHVAWELPACGMGTANMPGLPARRGCPRTPTLCAGTLQPQRAQLAHVLRAAAAHSRARLLQQASGARGTKQ